MHDYGNYIHYNSSKITQSLGSINPWISVKDLLIVDSQQTRKLRITRFLAEWIGTIDPVAVWTEDKNLELNLTN